MLGIAGAIAVAGIACSFCAFSAHSQTDAREVHHSNSKLRQSGASIAQGLNAAIEGGATSTMMMPPVSLETVWAQLPAQHEPNRPHEQPRLRYAIVPRSIDELQFLAEGLDPDVESNYTSIETDHFQLDVSFCEVAANLDAFMDRGFSIPDRNQVCD